MADKLEPGLEAHASRLVEEKHLASVVGSGLVDVFSTAMMIGGMESAAVAAVQPYLSPEETTVGVHVDVEHKAATPLGMKTTFYARLLEISANGKGLKFRVEARDETEIIGEGFHQRVIVNKKKFESRAKAKLKQPKS